MGLSESDADEDDDEDDVSRYDVTWLWLYQQASISAVLASTHPSINQSIDRSTTLQYTAVLYKLSRVEQTVDAVGGPQSARWVTHWFTELKLYVALE